MAVTTYEIAGVVRLELRGADDSTAAYVRAQCAPYAPLAPDGHPPDVVVDAAGAAGAARLVDIQGSAGDGLVTATDGSGLYVLDGGRACAVPVAPAEAPATFAAETGFPLPRIFGRLVRPVLQLGLLRHGAVAVHAASVELDGGAVLLAGWSESGKTETALAFAEGGARFLSDKWTVVRADATAAAFPMRVGVRRWTLRYLPRLESALPFGARAQLAVGRLGAAAVDALRLVPAARAPLGALDHAVELAGRVALPARAVREAYGDGDDRWTAPLRALVLLTTVPGADVSAAPADAQWIARRLARTAAFERRDLAGLYNRRRYALADDEPNPVEAGALREETLLVERLATVPLLDVRAPFPVDPRRVADAVARCL